MEHVADGMEGAAVGAVKEAGSEVLVSGARPDPQFVATVVVDGCLDDFPIVAHDKTALAVLLMDAYVGIGKLENAESGHASVLQAAQFHLHGAVRSRTLYALGQCVAGTGEALGHRGMQAHVAGTLCERPLGIVGIVVPLPLQAQLLLAKLVVGSWSAQRLLAGLGLVVDDGVAAICTHHGPSVHPFYGQQVRHTSHRATVLHDDEPPVAVLELNHASLVQAVAGIGSVVLNDNLVLVRTVDVARAQADLPAARAAGRASDIVVAIDLVHVGALHAEVLAPCLAVLEALLPYLHRFSLGGTHIGVELGDVEDMLSVGYIHAAVVVEEESGVIEKLGEDSTLPGTAGAVGLADREVAFFDSPSVGGAEGHVEFAVVVTDGCGPRTVEVEAAALEIEAGVFVVSVYCISGHLPVDQVL